MQSSPPNPQPPAAPPGPTLTTTIASVRDYQLVAKTKVSKALYEYLASGTDDEQTLDENQSAFKGWYLRPRVLRPVPNLSCRSTFLGHTVSMPLFVSPAGVHALCDPVHGECATAAACARIGIPFGLSQHATRSIEDVATAANAVVLGTPTNAKKKPNSQLWYQAYLLKDRQRTVHLIQRAKAAGYVGIFLTVDSVRFGYREADVRNGFDALPSPHRLVNYDDDDYLASKNDNNAKNSGAAVQDQDALSNTYNAKTHKSWDQNSEQMFATDISWKDVYWLKHETVCRDMPLVIKGIMTGEDADLAVESGADGVMVSNHGGRQLDGCLSTIDALPEVVAAVAGRVPVFLDGGIRRGTDILKALGLGASAVGIGKPVFFALAVGGEEAVHNMLMMLKQELEAAMALTGCETMADVSRLAAHTSQRAESLVVRHPAFSQEHSRPPLIRSAL